MKAVLTSGYSIIELMIVVAIIGVLASIALPQYQDYVARSQITEAINLVAPARIAIEESYATNGSLAALPAATTELLGITSGKYVASISQQRITLEDIDSIVFTLTFKTTAQTKIQAKTLEITITPTSGKQPGTFVCSGGTVPQELWPASCR